MRGGVLLISVQIVCYIVSCVLIDVSPALIITRVARCLDCTWFILLIHITMGHPACRVFATPSVMVLRLNISLKYHDLIPTQDCSDQAPSFIHFYSE
jgi:hypothetical protein